MDAVLNKILIPVDFSINTEIAVKKALSLIGSAKATIHLLHVSPPWNYEALVKAKTALRVYENQIQREHASISIKRHVAYGHSVQRAIITYSESVIPDMIIIGKKNGRRKFLSFRSISPTELAKKTNCPVLTIKPGSDGNKTKIILLPISDYLPERKLEWAVLLARKYKAQIHLLAIRGGQEKEQISDVFLAAYHRLREQLNFPVEFLVAGYQSPAREALHYADLIMADLVLVTPQAESGIGGLGIKRHISDLLERNSKLQILDVERYKKNKI